MFVYLNGKILHRDEARISVFDHGFLYGDGIYETLRVYDGVVFMFDEHLCRLARSASLISLTLPLDPGSIKNATYETLIKNSLKEAYVRITISRGHGELGLDPDLCAHTTFAIFTLPIHPYPKAYYDSGIRIIIPKTRRNYKDALNPMIKSLNFLNNILAKIEAKKADAYEALMLNPDGFLAECTVSNLFFVKDGILKTPSVDCGILDGITRGILIDIAKRQNIQVIEDKFTKDEIYQADEVFLTNSTMEVMPVRQVDEVHYKVGDFARNLRKAYQHEVTAYVADAKSKGPSIWNE